MTVLTAFMLLVLCLLCRQQQKCAAAVCVRAVGRESGELASLLAESLMDTLLSDPYRADIHCRRPVTDSPLVCTRFRLCFQWLPLIRLCILRICSLAP